jgi:hypothetical protein
MTTWYTSASSAPATFPARNASATAASAPARSEEVATTRPSGGGGVSAETPAGSAPPGSSISAAAARSALSSTAPSSGGSRNDPASDPSSSNRHVRRRRTRAAASPAAEHCRCARANRSSWFPVIGAAITASCSSVAGVAIRVSARTLAYDSRAAANSRRITGSPRRARATRTCSRAVPEDSWHRHDSHAAQLPSSRDAQPRRSSNSASSTRNRQVAAAR